MSIFIKGKSEFDHCIDLHTHSHFSDGTCSPKDILELAAAAKLEAVALTDHDTVAGIAEFLAAAKELNSVVAVPGIELSTVLEKRELHIVGLFIDPESTALAAFTKDVQEKRILRNQLMANKLCSLGYEVNLAELQAEFNSQIIGRPHFARYLCERYKFDSLQHVFEKLIRRGSPAYVPRQLPPPQAAIAAIHQAGGVAVWAHPVCNKSGERSWCRGVLKKIVTAGLDAIEAYYTQFTPQQRAMVIELSKEFNLLLSGGSDFHGENHADVVVGAGYGELKVPSSLLALLQQRSTLYK